MLAALAFLVGGGGFALAPSKVVVRPCCLCGGGYSCPLVGSGCFPRRLCVVVVVAGARAICFGLLVFFFSSLSFWGSSCAHRHVR